MVEIVISCSIVILILYAIISFSRYKREDITQTDFYNEAEKLDRWLKHD